MVTTFLVGNGHFPGFELQSITLLILKMYKDISNSDLTNIFLSVFINNILIKLLDYLNVDFGLIVYNVGANHIYYGLLSVDEGSHGLSHIIPLPSKYSNSLIFGTNHNQKVFGRSY